MQLERQQLQKVSILLGVRCQTDLLYANDFRRYEKQMPNLQFITCISRDSSGDYQGHVQLALDNISLIPSKDIVYLCGNPNMIDDCFTRLTDQGFDSKSIRREKYISST